MKNYTYDLTLVVPCYNEFPHLLSNLFKIKKVMDNTRYSYEIILIDDCSSDNTLSIIKEIVETMDNARYISHKRNMGRGYTVREGLLQAKGKVAGFIDIDLEVDAHYIPIFVSAILDEHYDVSIGYRFYHIDFSLECLLRNILSIIYRKIVRHILRLPFKDTEAGYKFFNMETAEKIIKRSCYNKWFWDTEIVANAYMTNLKIKEIPSVFIRNPLKKSTVKVLRDSWQYIKDIYRFKKMQKNYEAIYK